MPGFEPIIISVKTETPIWTGDADSQTTSIKATSILGGLRFWAEAMVRSFGEKVCNITSAGDKDVYDKNKPEQKICRVCETFGCTGKGKGFGLSILEGNLTNPAIGRIKLQEYEYEKPIFNKYTKQWEQKKITPTWYLNNKKGKSGNFEIKIIPLKPKGITPDLALSFCLMLKWGTLGALDQFGYGMIDATIPEQFTELAKKALPKQNTTPLQGISLHDFFFFKLATGNQDKELPFKIRYLVRKALREPKNNKSLRHYFCGNMHGDTQATKYNIGIKQDGTIAGWGYYPTNGKFGNERDRCLALLKTILEHDSIQKQDSIQKVKWVEFNSDRDTEAKIDNFPDFMKKLLNGGL